MSFAAACNVVTQRSSSQTVVCEDDRFVTTLKTAAKETISLPTEINKIKSSLNKEKFGQNLSSCKLIGGISKRFYFSHLHTSVLAQTRPSLKKVPSHNHHLRIAYCQSNAMPWYVPQILRFLLPEHTQNENDKRCHNILTTMKDLSY